MLHPASILKVSDLKVNPRRGQNFLIKSVVARCIITSAKIDLNDIVIEIGSGLGALTLPLANLAKQIITLEIDYAIFGKLLVMLNNIGVINKVELRLMDALKFDWATEAHNVGRRVKVIANLPYSISSLFLFKLLDNLSYWTSATLMFQRELAERLLAFPGGYKYSQLSVLVQCWCEVKAGLVLGPEYFFPRPLVQSQIIHLFPRKYPLVNFLSLKQKIWYVHVVKAAFCQRRKTILNSLVSGLGRSKLEVKTALNQAGVNLVRRAETLNPYELGLIAHKLFF